MIGKAWLLPGNPSLKAEGPRLPGCVANLVIQKHLLPVFNPGPAGLTAYPAVEHRDDSIHDSGVFLSLRVWGLFFAGGGMVVIEI